MRLLNRAYIQTKIADSPAIYKRGVRLFEEGAFVLRETDPAARRFVFDVDGNYGDYTTEIRLNDTTVATACDCPYPGAGCKHIVAALLKIMTLCEARPPKPAAAQLDEAPSSCLTADEIRQQALEDRKRRAKTEPFSLVRGDMLKGEHLVETPDGRQYTVIVHDPATGAGHCDCPDYPINGLGVCKHLLFAAAALKKTKGFAGRAGQETFPFFDLYWDSIDQRPRLYLEGRRPKTLAALIDPLFDQAGRFTADCPTALLPVIAARAEHKNLRVSPEVLYRIERVCQERQLLELSASQTPPAAPPLKTRLYPYQAEGVRFGLFKAAALIGDEMGLGKTLQAIALAILKKEIFGFSKALIITPASLKEQWKREIERFSDEKALVIQGLARQRQDQYLRDTAYFKITNYEAVLRDTFVLSRFKPDLVILDEAQRIKNFTTKTAAAVKQIPRGHALVLTGTPLENKLDLK